MRRARSLALLSVFTPAAFVGLPLAQSATPAPEAVAPEVFSVAVTEVDPAALAVVGGDAADAELLSPEVETEEYSTLGVTWERDSALDAVTVQVRTRTDGAWSAWQQLETAEADGPDLVETDAPSAAVAPDAPVVLPTEDAPKSDVTATALERVGTEPLWVGPSDGVQVWVDTPDGVVPRGLQADLVDPGESPADAVVAQQPAGSAAAAAARPAIVTRAQWGADESIRRGSPSYSSTIKAGYVHHTASTNNYTRAQAPAMVRSFYAYHVKSNGWSDIGYQFLVDRFGTVYEGRAGGVDRPVLGAHAGGFNTDTFGVSMIGTYTSATPAAVMLDSVQRVLAWKLSLYGIDPQGSTTLTSAGGSSSKYRAGTRVNVRTVAAHRDTNATSCPGDRAYSFMNSIRAGAAAVPRNGTAAAPTPTTSSVIDQKYSALGGGNSVLGTPIAAESDSRNKTGRYRPYQFGSIYWSTVTGAQEVHGAIFQRWAALGYEHSSAVGWPITDERGTPNGGGRYNHFQRGSIYWSPSTGAREVRGAIFGTWAAMDWEKGVLGFPTTDEWVAPDKVGRFNHFQRGSVYWTPRTGAHEVHGSIKDRWASTGWELGRLGYPTSNEYSVPGGRASDFEHGRIVWTARTGATSVTLK